jgi:hypothetical protein
MIEDLRLSKNMEYSQIDDKDWVWTFNKITWKDNNSIILW